MRVRKSFNSHVANSESVRSYHTYLNGVGSFFEADVTNEDQPTLLEKREQLKPEQNKAMKVRLCET